jgi:hypothetical protein
MTACAHHVVDLEDLIDVGACDLGRSTFTTTIDNPYLPLEAGRRVELRDDAGTLVRVTALGETETVAGIETRVVEEYEAVGGRVTEISRNFFAQNERGDVCYFGEEVDIYDGSGAVSSHAGSWRADGEANRPGIFMPADLEVGRAFRQEVAPGVAEDQSKVVVLGASVTVPAGTFDDTAGLVDLNPLDGSLDLKVYARGIGLIVDEAARLSSYEPAG